MGVGDKGGVREGVEGGGGYCEVGGEVVGGEGCLDGGGVGFGGEGGEVVGEWGEWGEDDVESVFVDR